LEEIVMAIRTRRDFFGAATGIATKRLLATSRMVSTLTGIQVQRNKAIVGENAFAHEAGIHQDGILKERRTYEIMRPEDVGVSRSKLVLGKHSGRHALKARAAELGFNLTEEQIQVAYDRFKALADKKKLVYDEDIEAILEDESAQVEETYRIESLHISSGTHAIPTATVRLRGPKEKLLEDAATGDGPIDAVYRTIERMTGVSARLKDYRIRAVTMGKDAQGEVSVEVECRRQRVTARALSTDIIQASALAYLKAINTALAREKRGAMRKMVGKGL
jgi:2-isopropylmalate synthase